MTEKITGYLLLAFGVLLMLVSCWNVYGIFTKRAQPIELFNFKGISIDPSTFMGAELPPEQRAQLKFASDSKIELASPDLLNDTSNLFAHLLLMGFILNVGFKLASLGTMLIRPVVVKLKSKEALEVQHK